MIAVAALGRGYRNLSRRTTVPSPLQPRQATGYSAEMTSSDADDSLEDISWDGMPEPAVIRTSLPHDSLKSVN